MVVDTVQAPGPAGPQDAVRVFVQDADAADRGLFGCVLERVLDSERAEPTVFEAHEVTLLRQQPQNAVAILMQTGDAVARQALVVAGVEDREADTVEACQPVEGGDPQVAVAGLQDVGEGLHGQAVLDRPDLVHPAVGLPVGGHGGTRRTDRRR